MIKKLVYVIVILILLLGILVWFSPYQHNDLYENKAIINSILIKKSPEEVYTYLGNSSNASNWSTYVDHITCLNSDKYVDGELGSQRRCFKNEHERGAQWDEEILINEANQRRRLSIFNVQGFSFSASHLRTEQLYEEINGSCRLTFTLFVEKGQNTWWDDLKISLAAYLVAPIFEGNIGQIKHLTESK